MPLTLEAQSPGKTLKHFFCEIFTFLVIEYMVCITTSSFLAACLIFFNFFKAAYYGTF